MPGIADLVYTSRLAGCSEEPRVPINKCFHLDEKLYDCLKNIKPLEDIQQNNTPVLFQSVTKCHDRQRMEGLSQTEGPELPQA